MCGGFGPRKLLELFSSHSDNSAPEPQVKLFILGGGVQVSMHVQKSDASRPV